MLKHALTFVSLLNLIPSAMAGVGPKVVYGEDNRKDIYQSQNDNHKMLAKSTAAMIPSVQVVNYDGILSEITGVSLKEYVRLCSSENFENQIAAADCSGFLISDTHLVTAGHCMKSASDCSKNKWVFDFSYETPESLLNTKFLVEQAKVYSCRKIIDTSNQNGSRDYAVIELDRPVTDRLPLKLRTAGTIELGAPLVVIGHPTGIPTKIADGAVVLSTSAIEFTADLDTFGGNSGSAVFNDLTGEVEGILVRGATDYKMDTVRNCRVVNKCKVVNGKENCRGETVTKITGIKSMDPNNRPPTEAQIVSFLNSEPSIMEDFSLNIYKNCVVKTNDPQYNQLFIKGVFKGNFLKQKEFYKLKSLLGMLVMNGTCVKRDSSDPYIEPVSQPVREPIQVIQPPIRITPEIIPRPPVVEVIPEVLPEVIEVVDPVADKQLIKDVINNNYEGCLIRELPRRNFYQLYVKSSFKGNFDTNKQIDVLAKALRKYITQKSCNLKI